MRFRVFEQKAFVDAIVVKGRDPIEFLFMKKHGRLHVHFGDNPPFIFFRKTATVLDDKKQWESVTTYDVENVAPVLKGLDWDGVLKEFELWLSGL